MNYNMKHIKSFNESIKGVLKPKSEQEIDKNSENLKPNDKLLYGCQYNSLFLVQKSLNDGADPSCLSNLPIITASGYGSYDVVEFLLMDERVDPTDRDNYAIKTAYQYKYKDIVRLLLNDQRVKNTLYRWLYNDMLVFVSN